MVTVLLGDVNLERDFLQENGNCYVYEYGNLHDAWEW